MRFSPALVSVVCGLLTQVYLAASREATVTVYPSEILGPVNPLLFGNNQLAYQDSGPDYSHYGAGIWDPLRRQPVPEYVALSKLAGITVQRWPGGCTAHNYNWKNTVGPLDQRPNMPFGLPEFLTFCEATEAIPLITLSVFWGDETDAADIVEYLNSPNDGSNPNGGVEWAAVRAADGHPEPYGVIWFEYGNEDWHGEHASPSNPNPRTITAAEYAQRYLRYQAAMKAVDPAIRLGAVLQNGLWDWNREVLQGCGAQMDFAIEHTYVPVYYGNNDEVSGHLIAQACLACDAYIQDIYEAMLDQIQRVTGRDDVPLAITEYNGHLVQEHPVPYRQCLANALRNAEHLRVMMRPENRILMANFWQFANEYWGMVRGDFHRGQVPVLQANFLVFQLYREHFGHALVRADVQCQTWDFPGAAGVPARSGEPREFRIESDNLLPPNYTWEDRAPVGAVTQHIEGPVATAEFHGEDVNFYFPRVVVPAEPNTGYRLVGQVRTENLTGIRGAGFQVGDARGWVATQSCTVVTPVKGSADWTDVVVDYVTLPDTTAIEILARKIEGGPATGVAQYRLVSLHKFQPANPDGVPDLGVNSAIRDDGTVCLMIVNKNVDEPVTARVQVVGWDPEPEKIRAWLLSGPSPTATNLVSPPPITIREHPVALREGVYSLELPPCSLAAVEIRP